MRAQAQAVDVPGGSLLGEAQTLKSAASAAAPALLFGLRLSASVCLALLLAFWLQLQNPHWAATSAGIVAQPALGASLRKGRFRAIGTVLGAIFIVLLTAASPQNRLGFLAGLTLWAAICGYLAAILPNFTGYAAALAGYTAAIVFAGITQHPENVFLVAVWRTTEIGIGIFSAGLVHSLTDFGDARRRLAEALAQIGRGIAAGLGATLLSGNEALELRSSRRALIDRTIALDPTIDEALGEPSHMRHQRARLLAAREALFLALSGWRGIGNHLATSPKRSGAEVIPALLPPLAQLADGDWLAKPEEIRALCRGESGAFEASGARDLSSRLIVEGVTRVLRALEAVADTLVAIKRPGIKPHARTRTPFLVPDLLPARLSALRIVLALALAELIWILTSWPSGPIMITFTAVNVILSARIAGEGYTRAVEFALGCHIAAALALITELAILPRVQGDPFMLCGVLTAVLLPLGALSAGCWRKQVFVAAVANFMPILALENEPTYDAARLFDTILAVSAGTVIAAVFFRLLPSPSPRRRIERLLRFTLRDLRALTGGRRTFEPRRWVDLVSSRLAAMPTEASLEHEAELLATLSVGEAAIALRRARAECAGFNSCEIADGDLLDRGLASLTAARAAEARELFARLAARQSEPCSSAAAPRIEVSVHATLIADALQRHERFFSRSR